MKNQRIQKIKNKYTSTFNHEPLLIASPGRINLIGEHVDYNGGWVLPAAIDKYIYMAIEKANTSTCTAIALDVEEQIVFDLNEIEPIAQGGWQNYILGVVGELQKRGKKVAPFNLVFSGDIPMGAGLSSSAALENGIALGLNQLFDFQLSKKEMIAIAQKAEHNYVGVQCGIMDQFASMMGSEKNALLLDCQSLDYEPVPLDLGNYTLLLLNTNVSHSLADSAYNERRATCERAVTKLQKKDANIQSLRDVITWDFKQIKSLLSPLEWKRAAYVIEEILRVEKAQKALEQRNFDAFGALLFQSHDGLQNAYEVSCAELDFLVLCAKENPAIKGARMMGGGFGGCTINFIHQDAVDLFVKETAIAYQNQFNKALTAYAVRLANGTHLI